MTTLGVIHNNLNRSWKEIGIPKTEGQNFAKFYTELSEKTPF